jgi:ankyrin repeat protein
MAWEKYFHSLDPAEGEQIRRLFPDDSCLDEFNFTNLHRIALGLNEGNLATELFSSPQSLNNIDSHGNTALLWAVKRSDLFTANLLLDHHADTCICDYAGRSPLHYAARCKNPELIKKLIKCGADTLQKSAFGSSALHFAVVQGADEVAFLQILLDAGIPLDGLNYKNRTALSEAAKYDYVRAAKYLIERGANINNQSTDGETALMEAVVHKSHRCLSLLLGKNGSSKGVNKRGNSILHLAALSGDVITLEILSEARLDGIDIRARNTDNLTAFDIAKLRNGNVRRRPEGFLEAFRIFEASIEDASLLDEGKLSECGSDRAPVDFFTDALEFQE